MASERRVGKHEPVDVGREYIINEGTSCEGRVIVARSGTHFCTVRGVQSGAEWETMCYRLTTPPTSPTIGDRERL